MRGHDLLLHFERRRLSLRMREVWLGLTRMDHSDGHAIYMRAMNNCVLGEQAVTTVQVGTQVSGTIKALHADFNARVRRGQVVAELEPSLFRAQVEQARASIVRCVSDQKSVK
jgi:hypothetical protein